MIRAFLSIKNNIFRQSLQRILEEEGNVLIVGHCGEIDRIDFLNGIPDIFIVEIWNNSTDFMAIDSISKRYPDIKTLVISNCLDVKNCSSLINAGAKGCLKSSEDLSDLFVAISDIMYGKIHFPHEMLNQIMENSRDADKNKNNLTLREIEVLRLLCDGLTNEQISEKLHLSFDTVKWHRSNILIKCSCKNVLALYKYAIRNKIIEVAKVR